MTVERFLEWYPRYRQALSGPVVKEIYQFLASPQNIWAMDQACKEGRPALNGVVKELEEAFKERFDFDNPVNRRMIGSMIKEIIHDFGFRRKGQRLLSGSRYFTTASFYELEEGKAQKAVSGMFAVQNKDESPAAVETLEREFMDGSIPNEKANQSGPAFSETDKYIEKLIHIIDDENRSMNEKRQAMEKLGNIGKTALSGIPAIRKALDDRVLTKTAVDTLTQVARSAYKTGRIPDIIAEFTWMLRHHDAGHRIMAAEALGKIGVPGATESADALAETLRDENEEVRRTAAWSFYKIGHPVFNTAATAMVEALEDEDEEVRIAAARALGVCAPLSVKLLVGLLEHENPCVCRLAAVELGRAGEYARVDSAKGLLKALNSSDLELKTAAAWALGSIGETTEGTIEALSKAGKDNVSHVREKAVWSLGRIGAKLEHFDSSILLGALGDENKNVRKAAAWALGNIKQKAHNQNPTSRLMNMLHDESKEVQEKAAWALGKLGACSSMAKPCVPLLIEALSDEAWTLRKAAAQALGRIGFFAIQALPKLATIKENREEKEIVRDVAGWAIEEISKYKDDDK